MDVQAQSGLVAQRTQTLGLRLAGEVQLRRVLYAKDNRKLLGPLQGRISMRLQNLLCGHLLIVEEAVGGQSLPPAVKCGRNAALRTLSEATEDFSYPTI